MKYEHFWMMRAAVSATAVVIGGAATTALAQQDPSTTIVGEWSLDEQGRSARVSYSDLNLTSAQDERVLYRRVKGAARSVCTPNDDQLVYRPFSTCVEFASDGARPQIDLAVRRAREIAHNGVSSIPLVAIAVVGVR